MTFVNFNQVIQHRIINAARHLGHKLEDEFMIEDAIEFHSKGELTGMIVIYDDGTYAYVKPGVAILRRRGKPNKLTEQLFELYGKPIYSHVTRHINKETGFMDAIDKVLTKCRSLKDLANKYKDVEGIYPSSSYVKLYNKLQKKENNGNNE